MAVGDREEKRLNNSGVAATQLGTTTTTIATAAANYDYIVKQIIICNTDGVDRLVTLAIGSAATAANCFIYNLPVAAYDTVVHDTGIILASGETLQGLSDTASKVNVTVVGWRKQVS